MCWFVLFILKLLCSWAFSKLHNTGLLLWMGRLQRASLCGLQWVPTGPLCLSWRDTQVNKPSCDMPESHRPWCVLVHLVVLSWHEHLSGLLFLWLPLDSLKRDEKVYWILGRKWLGKRAWGSGALQISGSLLVSQNAWLFFLANWDVWFAYILSPPPSIFVKSLWNILTSISLFWGPSASLWPTLSAFQMVATSLAISFWSSFWKDKKMRKWWLECCYHLCTNTLPLSYNVLKLFAFLLLCLALPFLTLWPKASLDMNFT